MTSKAVAAYLAAIGSKGGKASGPRKARSPEHYKAMAAKSAEAKRKRKDQSRDSAGRKRTKSGAIALPRD